jgi:hypothetical protein
MLSCVKYLGLSELYNVKTNSLGQFNENTLVQGVSSNVCFEHFLNLSLTLHIVFFDAQ